MHLEPEHHRLVPERGFRQLSGPTLWNRTRTSRDSIGHADQLHKSGVRAPRARGAPRSFEMPPQSARRRSSSSFFGCQRAGASGAPCAFVRSLWRRAHLGRRRARLSRERTNRDSRSGVQIASRKVRLSGLRTKRPETSKGRLVSLGGPSVRDVWLHVTRGVGLRRYRYRAASGRTQSTDAARASRPSRFPMDYVRLVSTRHELRTMKRITARERSVKRFLDEIDKDPSRLRFRHRGESSNATTVTGALIASCT